MAVVRSIKRTIAVIPRKIGNCRKTILIYDHMRVSLAYICIRWIEWDEQPKTDKKGALPTLERKV